MADHDTTDSLVNDIKRRVAVPINQAAFTNADIINYLNDEMESVLVPLIMSLREEFFVTFTDIELSDTVYTANVPSNAIGGRLRDVVLVDTTNNDTQLTNLPLLTLEQMSSVNNSRYNIPSGFHMVNNKVNLYPASGYSNETLRLYYFKRPGRLVPVNNTGKITSIDTNTNVLTLDFLPTAWTTSDTVDVIEPSQPFENMATALTVTVVNGFDLTVSDVTGLSVGDYVSLNGESCFPQIPHEAQQLLVQGAKMQMLDSMGDNSGWKTARVKYDETKLSLTRTMTPRVDGQVKKVVSKNNVFNYGRGAF